jgi:ribonuclease HII
MLNFEIQARKSGYHLIAGVDEAGRGPLAGPVIASAVILPENIFLPGLNDSKLLSPARRDKLYQEIVNQSLAWSTGLGTVSEIDSLNILQATRLAMLRALTDLSVKPDFILLDALRLEGLECPQQPVIGGDRLSQSIAAASIVAKVTRDRLMRELDSVFPGYGFARHKGYGTPEHYRALAEKGSCPLHRQSFLPDAERKRR